MNNTTDEPIEVVTPFAAGLLAGVTAEAIRAAAAQGRVRTRAVLSAAGRPTRLIDLDSVIDNWNLDRDAIDGDINLRLDRSLDFEGSCGRRYRIVSPAMWLPVLEEEPPDPAIEMWHARNGLWPVWFRGS